MDKQKLQEWKEYFKTHPEAYIEWVTGCKLSWWQKIRIRLGYKFYPVRNSQKQFVYNHHRMLRKILFENGSSIIQTSNNKSSRGKRANILTYWDDKLGCFVEYNGNKPEGERHRYFDLDENDEFVYFRLEDEDV